MFSRLRTLLFWCHLTAGVVAGVVILMMCVTGVALTYQRQMQWWADTRHFRAEPAAGAQRLPAATLIAAAGTSASTSQAATITYRAEPSAPAAVAFGTQVIFVNPYTAHVYGEGTGQGVRQFFTSMVNWHRYVAMAGESRPTGRAITGASNLLFLFIVLSGAYLWWPKSLRWTQFKSILMFRGGLRGKARDFNWHNVIGFWSVIPLAIVVYSGVVISYPWATNMVYRAMGEQPPPPAAGRGAGPGGGPAGPREGGPGRGGRGGSDGGAGRGAGRVAEMAGRQGGPEGPGRAMSSGAPQVPAAVAPASEVEAPRPDVLAEVDFEGLIGRAMRQQDDWTILIARVPTSSRAPVSFTLDRGDGGQPHLRSTLALAPRTGAVETWEPFTAQTPGRRLRSILRFAHTGEVLGLTGQTIAGLVSAGGAVLVYTGIALALRRLSSWRVRRRRSAVGMPAVIGK